MPIKKSNKPQVFQAVENIFNGEANQVVFAEITYLKKRIHLVEGERKANYEINEETLKENEALISTLKANHAKIKSELANVVKTSDNYFLVIRHKLGGEKNAYAFRDKDLNEAIEILECKIGDLKNKENLQTYKKAKLRQQLDTLERDEITLRNFFKNGNTFPENPRLKKLNEVENATALMEMKIVEAENIRSRYKHMIEILEQENYNRKIQMDHMHKVVGQNKKEAANIQSVLESAEKAKHSARVKLIQTERKTIQEYTEREQSLLEHRHRLKQIRDSMEAIGAKLTFPKFHMVHRDSSISDGLYPGTAIPQQEAKGESLIEVVYDRLSEMTGESDPELIAARFKQQREHLKELEVQEKDAKAEVRRCKIRKKFLQDKVNQIQFSGGLRRETLDERTLSILKEMDVTDEQRQEADKSITAYTTVMEEMMGKLIEICDRNDIPVSSTLMILPTSPSPVSEAGDLPPAGPDFIGNRIMVCFKSIIAKLENMFEEQDIPLSTTTMEADTISDIDMELNMLANANKPSEIYLKHLDESFRSKVSSVSADEGTAVSMRRLSIIDVTTNEAPGDIVGRNITSEMEGLVELDEMMMTTPVLGPAEEDLAPSQTLGKSDSSEEEEAVARTTIKRQSQILLESKTRKGRFNPGMTLPIRRRV